MATRRTLRVARQIKQLVSRALIHDLADPRLGFITVTEVNVAPDMKQATVRLSVMGDQKKAALCLKAVRHARGRMQTLVSSELSMKVVPRLHFELDQQVKKSIEVARLINLARSEYHEATCGDDEAPETPQTDEGNQA
jgi:ribosome-binding factor A